MYAFTVKPGKEVRLKDFDPSYEGGLNKEAALAELEVLGKKITELQELLYAAGQHAVLAVFQGRDTAGKDGAINHLLRMVNIRSARAVSFKVPSEKERAHDYLWRVHAETPGRGGFTAFNRSHYEDVLVVRVHDLAPKSVWKRRYDDINQFEKLLADNDTVLLKFYLHISKAEQEQRLLEREKDPLTAWKLSVGDWKERELWDDYTEAYEDALTKCNTETAPWIIVPADHKWYRDLAVAEAVVDALKPLQKGWQKHLDEVGKVAKAELAAYRAELKKKSKA